ncbi:MAG: translation initiation factor IF-3 [Oscillospiraceae bacterium]|nr:translation initiation factor IF-3 [Oscillospiraceae bacterium]
MQINEAIRDREVRLIGPDGEQLGVVSINDAQERAAALNLDLVKIAPTAKPPVCKIIDYGKYKFESAKREKEARKNQKIVNIKEVKVSANIDQHDLETKLRNALKFLQAGDKVKVSLRFRGREITHASLGEKTLLRFASMIEEAEAGTIEKRPKLEGRQMIMFITPTKGEKDNVKT